MNASHPEGETATFAFRSALLFGVPVTKRAFFGAPKRAGGSDYASLVLGEDKPEDCWDGPKGYQRVCEEARRLADLVVGSGGLVVEEATLDSLAAASHSCDVVIVYTHWKGPAVMRADLRRDIDDFIAAIRTSPHEAAAPLRRKLEPLRLFGLPVRQPPILRERDERVRRSLMLELLADITASRVLVESVPIAADEKDDFADAVSRDLLDEAFEEDLVPGNRLELFDGLHTPGAIAAALAPAFAGTIDLSACQSLVLAHTVARMRDDDRTKIIHNRAVLDPLPRLRTLNEVLRHALASGCSYYDARLVIEHRIANERPEDDIES